MQPTPFFIFVNIDNRDSIKVQQICIGAQEAGDKRLAGKTVIIALLKGINLTRLQSQDICNLMQGKAFFLSCQSKTCADRERFLPLRIRHIFLRILK